MQAKLYEMLFFSDTVVILEQHVFSTVLMPALQNTDAITKTERNEALVNTGFSELKTAGLKKH